MSQKEKILVNVDTPKTEAGEIMLEIKGRDLNNHFAVFLEDCENLQEIVMHNISRMEELNGISIK